jgi:hypothetical protein
MLKLSIAALNLNAIDHTSGSSSERNPSFVSTTVMLDCNVSSRLFFANLHASRHMSWAEVWISCRGRAETVCIDRPSRSLGETECQYRKALVTRHGRYLN